MSLALVLCSFLLSLFSVASFVLRVTSSQVNLINAARQTCPIASLTILTNNMSRKTF